ncbi:MAG: PepSY-associated TM helix domain-containing protein [Arcobacteraceae bacterium]|jgi:sulfite reductase (NADPH) flavoprotein alpha-component|nr:PepSY-associated TM helix domain-containing protein [Arcobacteraceae bacterium]
MFNRFWFKVHWILGLVVSIPLMVIALTGSILSFEKEILKVINKDSYSVEITGSKMPINELLTKFATQVPNPNISSITIPSKQTDSIVINVSSKDPKQRKGINYYINPYTAELLPELSGQKFFRIVLDLHRRLMVGEVGKQIVAVSTISLLILSLSGVYLYWPRIRRTFIGSLTFSFKNHGRYFLYSMHSALGMWVLLLYILVTLTGLYWSYEWYRKGIHIMTGVPMMQHGHGQQQKPDNKQNNVNNNETPKEDKRASENPDGRDGKPEQSKLNMKFAQIEKAYKMFDIFVQSEYDSVTIRVPQKGTKYDFMYLDENPAHYRARNSMQLDIKSWELLKHTRYDEKTTIDKLVSSMVPLHTGEYFGLIGQTLMFLASLLMPVFAITGLMLYIDRKRKEKKKLARKEQ